MEPRKINIRKHRGTKTPPKQNTGLVIRPLRRTCKGQREKKRKTMKKENLLKGLIRKREKRLPGEGYKEHAPATRRKIMA